MKVGGIAVCAETFQGSVGGRRACLPLIQLFFCFCSVQTNTYRGIEGGNWLSSLGGEGVYLVRAVLRVELVVGGLLRRPEVQGAPEF